MYNCRIHNKESLGSCKHCGERICSHCLAETNEFVCPSCHERRAKFKQSRMRNLSILLLISLCIVYLMVFIFDAIDISRATEGLRDAINALEDLDMSTTELRKEYSALLARYFFNMFLKLGFFVGTSYVFFKIGKFKR